MSAKYNLVCKQGNTFNFQFSIKNDSVPWNLTNYVVTMTVRPFVGATTTTVVATTVNGLIVLDPTNGRVTVTIPSATTADFVPSRDEYDIVFDSGTVVTTILEGKFVVTAGVTV
jgi:hypothetical protein